MSEPEKEYYGPLFLSRGGCKTQTDTHTLVNWFSPLTDKLDNWTPLGWYAAIPVRKHWWQLWKPKTKVISGKFQ